METATTTPKADQPANPANLTIIAHDDNEQSVNVLDEIAAVLQGIEVVEPFIVNLIHAAGHQQVVLTPKSTQQNQS